MSASNHSGRFLSSCGSCVFRRVASVLLLALAVSLSMLPFARAETCTSTGSRYGVEAFAHTLEKYSSIMELVAGRGTVPIPGLVQTANRIFVTGRGLSEGVCDNMVPQGVCVTGRYILVTAYCHDKKHPSTIYVIDRDSGEYLCNLSLYEGGASSGVTEFSAAFPEMPVMNTAHVGGIAYDDAGTVWVANGSNVSPLSLSVIDEAVEAEPKSVAVALGRKVGCGMQASFLTWYKDLLWVGYCNMNGGKGSLRGMRVVQEDVNNGLDEVYSYTIPGFANGAAFCEIEGRNCLALNVSNGRLEGLLHPNYVSRMILYEADLRYNGFLREYGYYTMPPMAEELEVDGDRIYTVFESGASCYSDKKHSEGKGEAEYIVDRVCVGSASSLFYWTAEESVPRQDDYTAESGAKLTRSIVSSSAQAMLDGFCEIHCEYNNRFVEDESISAPFMYTDALLLESAHRGDRGPDPEMAKISVSLAAAAYQQGYIKNALEEMGFAKYNLYNYNRESSYVDNDFVAFSIAQKQVNVDGRLYTLYVVPVRGTPHSAEWFSNFNLGTGDDHVGFHLAAQEVLDALEQDFFSCDNSSPDCRRILITGHSRGAAVANIVAGHLTGGLGGRRVDADGVFSYTFACPAVSRTAATSYDNIINFNFSGDPVPQVPLSTWGFVRYGRSYHLDSDDANYDNMTIQFQRETEFDYIGTRGAGTRMAKALGDIIESQLQFNEPATKNTLDAIALVLGGYKGTHNAETFGGFFVNQFTRTGSYLVSLIKNATNFSSFHYIADECEALIEDVTLAKADYDGNMEDWKERHRDLIDTLTQYVRTGADIGIITMGDIDDSLYLIGKDLTDLRKIVEGSAGLMNLFLTTNGDPISDINYGHTPETYVMLINSMYLGGYGWYDNTALTHVANTGSVRTVGPSCFEYCDSLKRTGLPDSIQVLGRSSFSNCQSLEDVALPEGLERVDDWAFSDCNSLKAPAFPASIVSIGKSAYYGCNSIEALELPDHLVSCGRSAFSNCKNLKSVTLPVDLDTTGVFDNDPVYSVRYTPGITGSMLDKVPEEEDIFPRFEFGCMPLEQEAVKTLRSVEFCEGITHIGDNAFYGYYQGYHGIDHGILSQVKLPSTLRSIGEYAFFGQGHLTQLQFPDGLTTLGAHCFEDTGFRVIGSKATAERYAEIDYEDLGERPEVLVLPESLTEIPDYCFYACSRLEAVEVPEHILRVGNMSFCSDYLDDITLPVDLDADGRFRTGTFQRHLSIHYTPGRTGIMPDGPCALLSGLMDGASANVNFAEGITRIGDHAFEVDDVDREDKVKVDVHLPSTLKSIGERAFAGQDLMQLDLPDGLTELGEGCFEGNDFYQITYGDDEEEYFHLKLPSRLEHIPENCFANSGNLESISLPDTVRTIGAGAFEDCYRCKSLELGQGVEKLGDRCFAGAYIEKLVVPASVKSIGTSSLASYRLNSVEFQGAAPTLAEDAFLGITAEIWYHPNLPGWNEAARQDYGGTLTWKPFDAPEWSETVYTWSKDLLTVTAEHHHLDDETLVEQETVATERSVAISPTETEMGATTYTAVFENETFDTTARTVTDIPALDDMALLRLPAQLRRIEADAFAGLACQGVIIPDGCESIGPGAFANCKQLVYVFIPASVQNIDEDAFKGCPQVRIDPAK